MSNVRNAIGQSTWLFMARAGGATVQAVVLAALARFTSPAELGTVVALIGLLAFCSALSGLGLGPYALTTYARDRCLPQRVIRLNSYSTAVVGVVSCGLIIALVQSKTQSLAESFHFLPLALWAAAEKNSDLWTNLAVSLGRSQIAARALLFNRVTLFLIYALTLYTTSKAVLAYTLALAAGAIVGNLILRRRVQPRLKTVQGVPVRIILKRSYPFLLNTVGRQIKNLDATVVAAVGGATIGGFYGLPARLTSPLLMVANAPAPVIMRLSAMGTVEARRALRVLIGGIVGFALITAVMVAALAPVVTVKVFGPEYFGAIVPLQILGVALIFGYAITLLTSLLQGRGQERVVGYTAVLANIFGLGGILFGTHFLGASGAALGLSVSYAIHMTVLLVTLYTTRRSGY